MKFISVTHFARCRERSHSFTFHHVVLIGQSLYKVPLSSVVSPFFNDILSCFTGDVKLKLQLQMRELISRDE